MRLPFSLPLPRTTSVTDCDGQATGNLGKLILDALLQTNQFELSVVSRTESTAEVPSHSIKFHHQGDHASPTFLAKAFAHQDAVVFCLGLMADPHLELRMIEAAAKAGVPWIVPGMYGVDVDNAVLRAALPPLEMAKERVRQIGEIGAAGGVKWLGFISNPWLEYVRNYHYHLVSLLDPN